MVVTLMRRVLTLLGLTLALARMDLLEMESVVTVWNLIINLIF